ncbi:MAG: type 11 methyltransferase [Actinomycetia bacterium]|nr:type 11 methyltransferase [Actinomycetes bacterium]
MAANETARTDWNGASGNAWVAGADQRDVALASVLDALVRAAELHAGERVLDLGCGCGATTLAAAGAVGPDGHALGIDLSDPMLEVARRRAVDTAVGNVDFVAGDLQTDDLPAGHDIAISRFGTMFFDDPGAAFANIGRGVRPGGRLCIATWQPLAANEWLTVPTDVLLPYGSLPTGEPGAPGMFAQSSADSIRDLLEPAGFTAVDVEPVQVQVHLGTAAEATDYLSTIGLARAVLDALEPSQRSAAVAALTEAIAERAAPDGVTLAGAILVTTASR